MKEKKLEEIKETVETAIEETKEKKREEKSVVVDKPKRVRKTKKKLQNIHAHASINWNTKLYGIHKVSSTP